MDFREALLTLVEFVRFPEEALKLQIIDAINTALTLPEPIDGEIVADTDDQN